MKVTNSLDIEIKINGVNIPYSTSNTVLINQNINVSLPAVRINLTDASSILDRNLPLNDGATLDISVGDGNSNLRSATFRTLGTPARHFGAGNMAIYQIHAILDAINFIRANPQRGIQGNATNAIQNIAKTLNLNAQINTVTNDAMMWLPGRKTWSGFVDLLARHAWTDETSAIHAGVDLLRNLHFHDITQLYAKGQIKLHLFHGSPPNKSNVPIQMVDEFRAENLSGLLNNTYGYGLRMPQTSVITGEINKLLNVKAMAINNALDISRSVLDAVANRGRLDIPRVLTGNSHNNYLVAEHQNKRIKSTYSQVVEVLISRNTNLTLFDMVQFTATSNGSVDDSVTGLYCITAISSAVKGRQYKEKLQLTSAGPANGNTGLV